MRSYLSVWWHQRSLRSQMVLAITLIGLLALVLNAGVICAFLGGPLYEKGPVLVPRWDRAIVLVTLSTLLAVTLVLCVSFLAARSLVQPLHVLTTLAKEMATGQMSRRMALMGPAEMQILARAFNAMLEDVSHQRQVERDLLLNVSHELAAPLGLIRGYAEALSDGMMEEEGQRQVALQAISAETVRLSRLSEDLLEMARMESGQSQVRLDTVPMAEFLAGLVQRFTPQARRQGIQISQRSAPDLPFLLTDGLRLEQVLVNLLTNALRATPAGGAICLQAGSEKSRLRIDVADTGPGIPSEHLARIWEPFYQVDAGRDRRAGTAGVGLGLTICRTIITWLGGQIDVKSSLGEGTIFTIWLPLAPGEQKGRNMRRSEALSQGGWSHSSLTSQK